MRFLCWQAVLKESNDYNIDDNANGEEDNAMVMTAILKT